VLDGRRGPANKLLIESVALLKVATCRFPVGADIDVNLGHVKRQMAVAAQHGARVAHFPEGAMSGYAGADFESFAPLLLGPPPGGR
jgi:predicted amidohydrolase